MIVISNTTPLRYLIEIETTHILPALFGRVVIPQAVFDELNDPKTPEQVKEWFRKQPEWLEIRMLSSPPASALSFLDYGEREAISLACDLRADAVLIDDRAARKAAEALSLTVLPTLALLEQAAVRELIDLPQAIDRLSKTTFRATPELFDQILERHKSVKPSRK
jgi:predicted nucleic acid-binding protein